MNSIFINTPFALPSDSTDAGVVMNPFTVAALTLSGVDISRYVHGLSGLVPKPCGPGMMVNNRNRQCMPSCANGFTYDALTRRCTRVKSLNGLGDAASDAAAAVLDPCYVDPANCGRTATDYGE